jgi:uncharacterized protein YidB (DUF937 family)
MGWLDAIASTGLKELASSPQAAQLLAQYLGQPSIGGLPKLTELFDAQGLGAVLQSWLGQGAALPISAEQVQAVLGSDIIQAMASKVGIDPAQAVQTVMTLLPQAVQLLASGKAGESGVGGLLAQGLSLFGKS